MNVTIFSKDRACQLELLLRSIREKTDIKKVTIIYAFSTPDYEDGYRKLIYMEESTIWTLEKEFKMQVDLSVDKDDPYTMFLTDDAVFKDKFSINDLYDIFSDPNMGCLSLMLGENITWAYEEEREVKQPGFPVWNWRGSDIDFNYPMSVISHIWRTPDIKYKLLNLDYDKPYNLESCLNKNPIDRPLMTCYRESKVVHIANNVVAPTGNKSGGQSVKKLNDRFLDGERIKWEKINNNSVHFEWEYKFERMV